MVAFAVPETFNEGLGTEDAGSGVSVKDTSVPVPAGAVELLGLIPLCFQQGRVRCQNTWSS
jgi:hypothetical protein